MLPEGLQFPAGNTLGGVGRFAISPDGKRLVFVGVDNVGNQMLWLRPLDSLTATPIAGTTGGSSPFWSPDSDSIAFFAQQQLKAVTLSAGATRIIASQAFNATGSWSGDTILFTTSATAPISRVPANGGTPRTVTTLDQKAGDLIHRSPFFLPDGRHFLYVAVAQRPGGTAPRAIYIGSIDEPDGAPHLVMESGSSVKYADGYLVYLRENTLVAQPFDPDRFTLTGEPRTIADRVELSGVSSGTFSFSQTGALVYQTVSDGSQLEWVDRQGRVLETVGEPGRYGDLELSPDARQAAVSVLDPTTNTRDIWIIDLARGVRSRLTFDRAEDVAPVWSPDGARIAFASNRSGHFDLYQKAAGGTDEEQMLGDAGGENYPSSWAKDGSLLVWTFAGANTGLMRLAAPDAKAERWLGGGASQATLSRDNRWALYASNESGRLEVLCHRLSVARLPHPGLDCGRNRATLAGGWTRGVLRGSRQQADVRRDHITWHRCGCRGGKAAVRGASGQPRLVLRAGADGERFLVNALREPGASAALTLVQNWRMSLQP